MYDGHHDDFVRDDAEHAIKRAEGCGVCADLPACKAAGACLAVLDRESSEDPPLRFTGQNAPTP